MAKHVPQTHLLSKNNGMLYCIELEGIMLFTV